MSNTGEFEQQGYMLSGFSKLTGGLERMGEGG